ncbi:hypothetical protein ANO11243_096420 [Dothideomycetidae sp. 11243]|nr:hypothetical protein ANO11243_096420 [fungal sp. No.11243]
MFGTSRWEDLDHTPSPVAYSPRATARAGGCSSARSPFLRHHSSSPVGFDRESTVEVSPVSTPPPSRLTPSLFDKRADLHDFQHTYPDSDDLIFLADDDDYPVSTVLFASPPAQSNLTAAFARTSAAMATSSSASPIDIATPRNSPPIPKTSNLTSQLQAAGAQQMTQHQQWPSYSEARRGSEFKPESFGYGMSNSRPINVAGSARRGSTQPGSMMQGMSWGGMSVGSFIRDDILMGTSPYNFQSPSFHSSSYLPKMEANFMRDYVCCGITLDSLHELLQHYEEAHAGVPTQTMGRTPRDQQSFNDARPQDTANAAAIMQRQHLQQQQSGQGIQPSGLTQGLTKDHLQGAQDMDELDAMELDDAAPAVQPPQHQFHPQPQFGRQQPRAPALNTSLSSGFGSSQMSTPTTPQPNQSFNFSSNPTVSSVNTPTFGTTSDSMTATPSDFSTVSTPKAGNDGFDFSSFGVGQDMMGTIDDPAKRLLSKQGFNGNQTTAQTELAKRIREQQISAGMDPNTFGFSNDEIKPFRCPVIGCEKAYKNQNGLKYHKQHGHTNQQLKENPDGTFSIVDPTTSIPYPGTVGMEKEKPYRCEVCGKRYKNLNGLKYHRQHSPPCNPDLKFNPALNMNGNLGDMNVNVAGAGLVGDGLGM